MGVDRGKSDGAHLWGRLSPNCTDTAVAVSTAQSMQSAPVTAAATTAATSEFLAFANVGQAIAATPAKLEKVRLLAEYFDAR